MNKYSLIVLLLMARCVVGDCYTGFDYCMNYTLPMKAECQSYPGCSYVSVHRIYFNLPFSCSPTCQNTLLCKNMFNECYFAQGLQNVYVSIMNSTDIQAQVLGVNDGERNPSQNYTLEVVESTATCNMWEGDNNCSFPAYLSVCINGSATTYAHPYFHNYPLVGGSSEIITAKVADFTPYYHRIWTFRSDYNNSIFNFTKRNANLSAWCDSYSLITINLTAAMKTNQNISIQTIQEPKYSLYLDNLQPRVRQDKDHFLSDDYYVPDTKGSNFTFILVDVSGGEFYNGELKVTDTINDTVGFLSIQQFDSSNTQYINLIPEHDYKLTVSSPTSSRDLGANFLSAASLTKYVIVSRPTLNPNGNKWDGLSIDITGNYTVPSISCGITSVDYVLTTFNITYSNGTSIGDWSSSGTTVGYTETIPTNQVNYNVRCGAYGTDGLFREYATTVVLRNESVYYSGLGNLTFPGQIMAIDSSMFLSLVSLAVILIVAGLFSAVSMGTGAIVVSITALLFYFIGFLDTTPMTIGMIISLAVMLKLSENRYGVVG